MSDRDIPLNDAMLGRKLLARWVIRGMLTLDTAMHLGGEGTERVDMPVLRDAREGKPVLTGTTFAGALRSVVADQLAGYGNSEKEPGEVTALFGAVRGDDDGSQSPLIVFDALGELPAPHGIEIRDGVAVSPETGIAEDHKKYDYEVLPAGTTFPIRVDLLVPADSGDPKHEKSLLEALAAALDAFSHGENSFGAKRSRGLGRVSATWAARRFDLTSADSWMEWALTDHEEPIPASPALSCISDVLDEAAPDDLKPLSHLRDARKRVVIDLDLIAAHDILVRSPGTEPRDPDVSHLRSGGAAVLPGTSLAGVMRAQALRIARLERAGNNDARYWIDRLFGPRFEGKHRSPGFKPFASRLRVGEATLKDSKPRRQIRVAIDPFTQGAVDTAMFDEKTEVGGRATVRLELRDCREGELGLVLLVVKDLLDGTLPVGGTSSIGRGVLKGTATVIFLDGTNTPPRTAELKCGKTPGGDAASEIDLAIRQFHDTAPLGVDNGPTADQTETGDAT